MVKLFNGPGGPYIKEVDLGPNPFENKMYKDPFNTTQWNKETWDKPEMRSNYREPNLAYESLSPKEFAGAGELYANYKYDMESGETTEEDPYKTPKKGSEMGSFGSGSSDSGKGSRKRKKLSKMD